MSPSRHIFRSIDRHEDKLKRIKNLEPRRAHREKWPKGLLSKEGVGRCPECHEFFYHKKWWTEGQLKAHLSGRMELKNKTFVQWRKSVEEYPMHCPADKEKRDFVAEGVLTISNLNPKIKSDVLHLVKNSEHYATGRGSSGASRRRRPDIEDRILSISENGKNLIIQTAENQLALRLGKKLHRSFKGGKLKHSFSHNEDAVRVYWSAP